MTTQRHTPQPSSIPNSRASISRLDRGRPLGINYDYPAAHVATALLHQVKTKVSQGGGKNELTGSRAHDSWHW